MEIAPKPIMEHFTLHRSGRARKLNPKYANRAIVYEWKSHTQWTKYQDLAHTCAVEATPSIPNRSYT
jgi:hypothetical protein